MSQRPNLSLTTYFHKWSPRKSLIGGKIETHNAAVCSSSHLLPSQQYGRLMFLQSVIGE